VVKILQGVQFHINLTLVLGLTLYALNGPIAPTLVSLAIFFGLSCFGSILVTACSLHQGQVRSDSIWQIRIGSFLAGGTFAILSWELSIALGLAGYVGAGLLILGAISVSIARKKMPTQRILGDADEASFVFQEFVSLTVLSLLLFIAAVPDLRSWLIPLAVVNMVARFLPRLANPAMLFALLVTVFIVRHATTDPSILVFTDDSVWAEGFSAVVQQTGFWSWVGASNVYSPLHWLAYGIAGWFTNATDDRFLFGVTMAFPATMSVVGALIVSQLRTKENSRLSFVAQILAIVAGLQLIGSQSISADLGFVAVLAFTLLTNRGHSMGALSYFLLICIAIAKIQFVPVIVIVIIVSSLLHVRTVGTTIAIRKAAMQLGVVLITSLLVLNIIPFSGIFGWETNAGWGTSKVRFRGSELTDMGLLREALGTTFLNFVPAVVLAATYLLTVSRPRISQISVPLCVSTGSFLAVILFEIENFEYFGWISGALSALLLMVPILDGIETQLSQRLEVWLVGLLTATSVLSFVVTLPENDTLLILQRIQAIVALLLVSVAIVLLFMGYIPLRRLWTLRPVLGVTGVALLCLPSLISTTDSFRESGFSIVAKSGYSLSDLGYTNDLLQAGEWVRQHTDPDEVIATNVLCEIGTACFLDGRPIISAATHRRTFIEAERFAYGYSPIQSGGTYPSWIVDRLQASTNCAASGDDASCSVLRSAGVELVLIDTTRVSGSNGLKVCASFGAIQVVSIQSSNPGSNGSCRERE
jgi:hypothetical protein